MRYGGARKMKKIIYGFLLFVFCLYSPWASANMGIPMLAFMWPLYWFSFIIVVAIEWVVMQKILVHVSRPKSLWAVFCSNAITTILGVPIVWIFLVLIAALLEFFREKYGIMSDILILWEYAAQVTFFSAWVAPYGDAALKWIIPGAATFLLLIFFVASYYIEYLISWRVLKNGGYDKGIIKKSVW